MTQPYPHIREGDLGTGNDVSAGPIWSTGGFALGYLTQSAGPPDEMPVLAIRGRQESAFGANPPCELKAALELCETKQFSGCASEAANHLKSSDPRLRALATKLRNMAARNEASLRTTLADMERTLTAGDLHKLKCQLQAIESIIDPADERLKKFRAAVDDPANSPGPADRALSRRMVRSVTLVGSPGSTNHRQHSAVRIPLRAACV